MYVSKTREVVKETDFEIPLTSAFLLVSFTRHLVFCALNENKRS